MPTSNQSLLEIDRRQKYAKQLCESLAVLIESDFALSELITLVIWHGSLPLGKGGSRYDIDFAVFLRSETPDELVAGTELLSRTVEQSLDVTWRRDTHYDGMQMFEAHTHWDATDSTLPHIGVHTQADAARNELTGDRKWQNQGNPRDVPFFKLYEEWRRLCFFYRHWIYEGVAVYDPSQFYQTAQHQGFMPATWFNERLELSVRCILNAYHSSSKGICTVLKSRERAFELVASLAHVLEQVPIGRSVRFVDDVIDFKCPAARELLSSVIEDDLQKAAKLILSSSRYLS